MGTAEVVRRSTPSKSRAVPRSGSRARNARRADQSGHAAVSLQHSRSALIVKGGQTDNNGIVARSGSPLVELAAPRLASASAVELSDDLTPVAHSEGGDKLLSALQIELSGASDHFGRKIGLSTWEGPQGSSLVVTQLLVANTDESRLAGHSLMFPAHVFPGLLSSMQRCSSSTVPACSFTFGKKILFNVDHNMSSTTISRVERHIAGRSGSFIAVIVPDETPRLQ